MSHLYLWKAKEREKERRFLSALSLPPRKCSHKQEKVLPSLSFQQNRIILPSQEEKGMVIVLPPPTLSKTSQD